MNANDFMSRAVASEFPDLWAAFCDAVDAWHDSEGSVPLPDWLGMTQAEYVQTVSGDGDLEGVIERRQLATRRERCGS